MKLSTIIVAVALLSLFVARGVAAASPGYHLRQASAHFQIQDSEAQIVVKVAAEREGKHPHRHFVTLRFDGTPTVETGAAILKTNAEKTIGAVESSPATKVIRICLITLAPDGRIHTDRNFNDEVVRECAKHGKHAYGDYMTVRSIRGRVVNVLSDEYGVGVYQVSVRVDRVGHLHLVRYQLGIGN